MKTFMKIFTAVVFILLYAPILLLIIGSFNAGKDLSVFKGFTLYQYRELFADDTLLRLLLNSLIVAVLATVLSTVLGTMASLGISKMKKAGRSAVMTLTNIPMTNPDIVTGVSLALLFAFAGRLIKSENILGFGTLLIAHVTFCLPYVILSVMPKLRQLNPNLNEAALDLGCTPVQSFFKVILPEIAPGVVSGALMAFSMSLDDFVISYFVYGPAFTTLPIEIYSYTKKPLPSKIYALFTVLFAAILLIMCVITVLQARDEKKHRLAETEAE